MMFAESNKARSFTAERISSYLKGGDAGFFLMAGPCAVESKEILHEVADYLVPLCRELGVPLIFKSSYRKANRSREDSFTGIGDERALTLLAEVREEYGVPIVTDIHESQEAEMAAKYVDVLQIPAFLCRQTELLKVAGRTGKIVNVKKGQFLSPDQMHFVAEKIKSTGNSHVILTERGNSFGYGDLIVDFRSIPIMKGLGYPVVMDVTHSLQQPNRESGITGGRPAHITTIASAAIAVGADGLFIETHPRPAEALSDGANMLPLAEMRALLERMKKLRAAMQ